MCGLFGFVVRTGASQKKKRALALRLALGNDQRGGDSWGYHSFEKGVVKGTGAFAAREDRLFNEMAETNSLLGHTRKATTGRICAQNAHPWSFKTIVGAHNGMVTNHAELNKMHGRSCEVDSQHLFHHIDDGFTRFDDIQAYGTIVFHHKATKEMFAGTFNSGELALAIVDDFGIVFSSDAGHLTDALQGASLKNWEVFELPPNRIHRIDHDDVAVLKGVKLNPKSPWFKYDAGTLMKQTGSSAAPKVLGQPKLADDLGLDEFDDEMARYDAGEDYSEEELEKAWERWDAMERERELDKRLADEGF